MSIDVDVKQGRIGGSDVAAILGLDNYRDEYAVAAQLKGLLQRGAPTPRMLLGHYLQPGIGQYYTAITGRTIEWRDYTVDNPQYPWLAITPDAVCRDERRVVEIKYIGWDQSHRWADQPPASAQLQAHLYMLGLDYPLADVFAVVGHDEPRLWTIQRDAELEAELTAELAAWHARYVIGDEMPPMGGSMATTEHLKRRWPTARAPIRQATPAEAALLDEYAQIRADEKVISAERARLENELRAALKEDSGITWPRGKFTWRNTADAKKTDWEALANMLLKTFPAEQQQQAIDAFTTTRPGARRIWFQCADQDSD